jgi:hypothetical protein
MAPRKPTPRETEDEEVTVTVEEVRTAVLHFIELAAAFEGRGLDTNLSGGPFSEVLESLGWDAHTQPESFAEDRRCLAAVVHALLHHRRQQRIRQRNGLLEGLVFSLSEIYRSYNDDTDTRAPDLKESVRNAFDTVGITVNDSELDQLILERVESDEEGAEDGRAWSIRGLGGPVEAAKTVIGRLVRLSAGTIAGAQRTPHPLNMARRPFGRWVPRQARVAFAAWIHDVAFQSTNSGRVTLTDLGTFEEERVGALWDRILEGVTRLSIESPPVHTAFGIQAPQGVQIEPELDAMPARPPKP